jgi:hypothetical protein
MPHKTKAQKMLAQKRRYVASGTSVGEQHSPNNTFTYSYTPTANHPIVQHAQKTEIVDTETIQAIRNDIIKAVSFAGAIVGVEIILSKIM